MRKYKSILILVFGVALFSNVVHAEKSIGLKAGTQAPGFTAKNFKGEEVRLEDYLNSGPVVVIFYRGGWCYYCNLQLKEYQKYLNQFRKAGASIIAISVDKQNYANKTVEEKVLGFEVISDPEAALLELYNVVYQVPVDLAKMYREKYKIDLEAHSGRTDFVIAVPATYVIDSSGEVVFASANIDYKIRVSAEEVLQVVEDLP